MIKGKIKTVLNNKGCGFIEVRGSGDIFFHVSCLEGFSFEDLYNGMDVEVYGTEQRPGKKNPSALKVCTASKNAGSFGSDEYKFLNPYNFIRHVKPKDNGEGNTPEEKLLAKMEPPPHDRMLGLNGKIECQITAQTPLFVSDSHGVKTEGARRSYRFFEYDGEKAIPASSLRGMVRSVYEAVTNSCFSVFDGERKLSYHATTVEARKLVPARVEKKKDGGYRLCLLTGTTGYKPEGPNNRIDMVYAAWVKLYKRTVDHKANKTAGENPKSPYANRCELKMNLDEYNHKTRCYALLESMEHPEIERKGKKWGYFKFWNVKEIDKKRENLSVPGKGERIEQGWLCITNQNIGNKHDERFFFRVENNQDAGVVENIPNNVIEDYNLLLEEYRDRHSENKRSPEPACSRFIVAEEKLEDGDLVYARLVGNGEKLEVEYIAPVSMPRVKYKKSIGELLPEVRPCREMFNLCPACRLFGWVKGLNKEKSSGDKKEFVSYKGRLRFEHAVLQPPKGKPFDEMSLAILSSPKPTTERFYLLPGEDLERKNWLWNNTRGGYNNESNRLRGRKFYRHHGKAREENYRVESKSEQNRSVRGTLPEGSVFTFSIKFQNLSPLELGALLWTLELGGKGFHRIGYAKPLGFGSVKLRVLKVNVLDPVKRYSSIKDTGIVPLTKTAIKGYIQQFKTSMCSKYAQNEFEQIENIRDILALSQAPTNELPVHYPRPNQEPRDNDPSFNWFVGNKKYGLALPVADKDKSGLPLIEKKGNHK